MNKKNDKIYVDETGKLDYEIEVLKMKKEKLLLEQEIEKIKKTVIEETIIKRVVRKEDYPYVPYTPSYPNYPTWYWNDETYILC